jgi:hypothetical protein
MKVEKSTLNKCLSILRAVKVKNSVSESYRRFSPRSGRVLSRRNRLVLVAVVGALTAFWLSGADVRRPAQAAQTPQAPASTPTPTGTPDYSNVKDILNGRRMLMHVDDLTLTGISNSDAQMDFRVMKTSGGTINDVSPRFIPPVPHYDDLVTDTSATQMGRMFAFDADVMATVYTQTNHDSSEIKTQRLGAFVYSPTAQTYINIELDAETSRGVGFVVTAAMMADFNRDGFDDLVVNYAEPDGQSAIQIINAKDVNAFSDGLIARGENLQTKNLGIYRITGGDGNPEVVGVDTMTVGDFNGDGQLDIIGVIPGAGNEGLELVLHTVDAETLRISDARYFPLPEGGAYVPPSQIAAAAGRFTAASRDQLLIAYATNQGTAKVKAVDFAPATFHPQEGAAWDTGNVIKTGRYGVFDWTGLLKLRVGRLNWSSQYDQAVLLHGNNFHRVAGTSSYEFILSNLAISPADFSITELSNFKTGDNYGTMHDITLGNFDNRITNPQNPGQNQTERNPNLQVALLTTDASGYTANVAIFNVDPVSSALNQFSAYSLPQESPRQNLCFIAGDMQGRSMRLGEPMRVTVYGTAQPSVLTAAPPMHVAHMADIDGNPQDILNVSAAPKDFYAYYDTESQHTNQSSSTHTTSWSFGAKESAGVSVSVGSVKAGNGSKATDTFKAGQDLKRSTENTHGAYSNEEFDASTKTVFSDMVQFSDSRFNIYIYPVIGQTVCPASKADQDGNCANGDKVPMTIQFSGPDNINSHTFAAATVEWYQPVWEYGNILSYPGSPSQLRQIVPGLKQLSNDYSFATDSLLGIFKTSWKKGNSTAVTQTLRTITHTIITTRLKERSGLTAGFTVGYSFGLDLNGSTGFGDLTKSTVSLGKSTGVGVDKYATFSPRPIITTLYRLTSSDARNRAAR